MDQNPQPEELKKQDPTPTQNQNQKWSIKKSKKPFSDLGGKIQGHLVKKFKDFLLKNVLAEKRKKAKEEQEVFDQTEQLFQNQVAS